MASEDRHITRIEKTEALFRTNGDHGQSAILTDQSEEWVYYNDDKTLLYYAAAQKTWDGAAWAYVNNDFGQVTLHDDLLVEEYIKRSTGTDDRIRFENDKISIEAGGAVAAVFEDDRVYSGLKKFGFGKTTLEAWSTDYVGFQIGDGGAIWTNASGEGASKGMSLSINEYYDGDFKRIVNDEVSHFGQQDGYFVWFADAADTADVAFTPTERMRLTSADLATASVQLGLGTSTPLLNVGSAAGDFTGDGIHIKSDITNSKKAYLVIEGDPNATTVFCDAGASANSKMYEMGVVESGVGTGIFRLRALDDDATVRREIMQSSGLIIEFNPDAGDVDFVIYSDPGQSLVVDGGTGNVTATYSIASGTLTQTATGPTDNLDVSGVNTVFINTASNNVTIGGFVGGVDGQVLHVVVVNATNNAILEHAEGTGNQDIYLWQGSDETLTAGYGGWTLVCNGTHWYDIYWEPV